MLLGHCGVVFSACARSGGASPSGGRDNAPRARRRGRSQRRGRFRRLRARTGGNGRGAQKERRQKAGAAPGKRGRRSPKSGADARGPRDGRSAFDNLIDAKRVLREIKLQRQLVHENVVPLLNMFGPPEGEAQFNDVYIVTELMDTDLHQVISSGQPLSEEHVQYFLYQILRGLKYVHSAQILHRDLKPSNLLVNANCDLKICDFGLARWSSENEDTDAGFMTEYVATRWYRAPEIMLSWKRYTKGIDVWSTGCIFAELLGRKPLFPGRDYIDQLTLITQVLGKPSEEDTEDIESDKARRFMRKLPDTPPQSLQAMYPNSSPDAIDLLQRMLTFNPAKRPSVEECLSHPFLASLHDVDDEPVAHAAFDFSFEEGALTMQTLRDLIAEEVSDFQQNQLDK